MFDLKPVVNFITEDDGEIVIPEDDNSLCRCARCGRTMLVRDALLAFNQKYYCWTERRLDRIPQPREEMMHVTN